MALADAVPYAVAHWSLDEASGTRADSVGSYDLTDVNTVGSTAGVFSNASSHVFANNEYLVDSFTPPTGTMTLSFWMRCSDRNIGVLGWNDNSTGTSGVYDRQVRVQAATGKLIWYVFTGSSIEVESDSAIDDGQWHHVAVTVNSGGSIKMFVDGAEQTDNGSGTAGYNSYGTPHFLIGRANSAGGPEAPYEGDIDDCVVLDGYALNASECSEIWNSGTGVAFADWAGGGGAFDPANGFPYDQLLIPYFRRTDVVAI